MKSVDRRGCAALRGLLAAASMTVACSSTFAATYVLINEASIDTLKVETDQLLPDFSLIDTNDLSGPSRATPLAGSDVFVYQPAAHSTTDLSDIPPNERADYACSLPPLDQYGSGGAHGFENADTLQNNASYVQGSGALRWLDDDPEPVRCKAAPEAVLSRGAINFGTVAVGDTSTISVRLANLGTADLLVGTLAVRTGAFSIVSDACSGTTLPPATACTFAARFQPSSSAVNSATLFVRTNDPVRLTQTLLLAGGYFGDWIFDDGFDEL